MNEDVLSVGQIYRRSKNALAREFRGPVWVTGEIKNIRENRGSWYITLIEPGDFADGSDIALDIACWSKRKLVVQAKLQAAGITLAAGMEVRVQGTVSLGKFGKVQLEMSDLDTEALLGRQQAEKRELLMRLEKEGLIDRNRLREVPLVPLRVGLVTSEGSDGFNDFMGELNRSGFRFEVSFAHSPVQGPAAPALLARAIESFAGEEIDVVAVVRGGGGELDAFDKEPVVRAIASSVVPVWAGIGHTADRSLTDELANQSFITPTACGQALVGRVGLYASRVSNAVLHLRRATLGQLDSSQSRLHRKADQARRCCERDLALASAATTAYRRDLRRSLEEAPKRRHAELVTLVRRFGDVSQLRLREWQGESELWRAKVAQFDPGLAVKRGYTLTFDAEGRLIRSVEALSPGATIRTQFADGNASSTVLAVEHEETDK